MRNTYILKHITKMTLFLLLMSPVTLAQHNCPQGFTYAGTLSGNGSFADDFNKRLEITLPENATLDASYQQNKVLSRKGNPQAQSNFQPKDIPKGIHISTYGSSDLQKGWAVSEPELRVLKSNNSGTGTQYKFGMRLYCTVGTSEATRHFGSCDVEVEVCSLPKK